MSFKDDLYARMGPWAYADADNGYALRTLCYGLAAMFEEVEGIAIGTDDLPGWATALSVRDEDGNPRAPYHLLPWLGQFVGVRLPTGLPEEDARERVESADGLTRGSAPALIAAAQRQLTGNKSVIVKEREGGAYKLTVYAYQQEAPYSDWTTYTNYVTNPNFTRDTTGWGTSGGYVVSGTIERDTTEKFSGKASLKVTTSGTDTGTFHTVTKSVAAGEKYTVSFWMKAALGTEQLGLLLGSGVDIASTSISPTTSWQRYSLTWTAAASALNLSLWLRQSSAGGFPSSVWIDNVQITQTPIAVDYIDGDNNGGTWTGTPGASTSTSIATNRVRDAIVAQKPAGIVLTFNLIANTSYSNVVALRATYTIVKSTYATYSALREAV